MRVSEQARMVLDSKEFLAWMPEEPEVVELKASTNLTIGFLLAAGVAGFYMLCFRSGNRDFSNWMPTLFGIMGAVFVAYIVLFGLGGSRAIQFDRERLVIYGPGGHVIVSSGWEEIISIKPNWLTGFTIKTRTGTASVWWWVLIFWNNAYSTFIYHVLKAFAGGYDGSKLSRYKVPAKLEDEGTYVYDIPLNVEGYVQTGISVFSFFFSLITLFVGPTKETNHGLFGFGLMMTLYSGMRSYQSYSPPKFRNGDRLMISDGMMTVTSKNGARRVPFELIGSTVRPALKPKAFVGAELYGEPGNVIDVDRRFIYRVFRSG